MVIDHQISARRFDLASWKPISELGHSLDVMQGFKLKLAFMCSMNFVDVLWMHFTVKHYIIYRVHCIMHVV